MATWRFVGMAAALIGAALAVYFFLLHASGAAPPERSSLIAFDAKTGRELWRARPPMALPGKPGVWGEVVLVEGGDDCNSSAAKVVAYDLASGKERWRKTVDSFDLCGNATLFIYDGIVAVQDGKRVLGIEVETGKVRWQHGLARSSSLAPGNVELRNTGSVVVIRESSFYRGLDRRTGEELWSIDGSAEMGPTWGSPDAFFIGGFFQGTGICRLRAIDLVTGVDKWQVPQKAACAVQPLGISEEFVVGCSGTGGPPEEDITAGLDAVTGALLWEKPITCTDAAIDDGRAFIDMRNPPESLTAVDPSTGVELWKIDIPSSTYEIVTDDGSLLLFPTGQVLALEAASGQQLWQANLPGSGIWPNGTIADGTAYVVASGDAIPRRSD